MKANPKKLARVISALQASGNSRLFRCESGYYDDDAKRNLRGRSHYLDDSTMKYFGSRILNSGRSHENLVFWIVESVSSRPDHGGKNKRFVAFDVFGCVVSNSASLCGQPESGWHRTTDAAMKAGREWIAKFDAVDHVAKTLESRAKADIASAKATLAALRPRKTVTA